MRVLVEGFKRGYEKGEEKSLGDMEVGVGRAYFRLVGYVRGCGGGGLVDRGIRNMWPPMAAQNENEFV